METVVDAFVWPLRLLGLAAPKEGELDHIPLLALPPNCIVNHLVPALDAKEKANLSLTCTTMSQLMAGSVKQLKFDGREMCFAARSPRLLQVGWAQRCAHSCLCGRAVWCSNTCSALYDACLSVRACACTAHQPACRIVLQ